MGNGGFLRLLGGNFVGCSGAVPASLTLWISLWLFRLGKESLTRKLCKLRDQRREVLFGRSVHVLDVQKVGVRDGRRPSLPDCALGHQLVRADVARPFQRSW